ncbi:phenylacetaldoxime dehydratase family protein [Asaia sp. HN010]|uniref:phenylacetaldoxime dehydratase family protein n=1 Tax=Asaia sp. HN010 TaxID=3081233 RepID=UPI00301906FF
MQAAINRQSVDLSAYPDLVMIMLGFRMRGWRSLLAMRRIGQGLAQIARDRPDGLLADEGLRFSLTHIGFRQYWRDMDALERFTRSEPHADWWRRMREMTVGAGFWHETYHARGGIEAVYVAMDQPVGLQHFAPERSPTGLFASARSRIQGSAANAPTQRAPEPVE